MTQLKDRTLQCVNDLSESASNENSIKYFVIEYNIIIVPELETDESIPAKSFFVEKGCFDCHSEAKEQIESLIEPAISEAEEQAMELWKEHKIVCLESSTVCARVGVRFEPVPDM